jgi:hypothetical protein
MGILSTAFRKEYGVLATSAGTTLSGVTDFVTKAGGPA